MTARRTALDDNTVEPSLGGRIAALVQSLTGFVSDSIELVSLEAKLAGRSVAMIVAFGIAAAFMMIAAWSLIVVWLVVLASNYISLALALFIAAIIHIVVGVVLALQIRRYTDALTFKATRRQLSATSKSTLTGQ